jgi:sec-independent protein translocase protein TatA
MHLGTMEILLILALALLFFGPARLPGLGNSLGSAVRGFKRGINGIEGNDPAPPALPPSDPKTPNS